jgi:hypothetical protein
VDPSPIYIILLSPVYFTRTVYFTRILYYFPLDTLITFVSSKPVRLTTSSQVGNKVFVYVCAGSATPSVVIVSPLLTDIKPWFLKLRENSLLYSSYLPLGVPNRLVIHHAQGQSTPTSTTRQQPLSWHHQPVARSRGWTWWVR